MKGFTLVELIIIIVLVGILAVFVVPKIDIETFKESADVDRFLANVRYAQHKSMITGHNWRLKIISSNEYIIDNDSNDSTLPQIPDGENPVKVNTSISSSGSDQIFFDYLGRPVDSGGNLISSQTIFTINSQRVIIEPFSGGIYVQ